MKSFGSTIQRPILSLFVLGVSLVSSVAYAACTPITSVPVTITTPGTYCLTSDLNYTSWAYAIDVQSDDVTVDFQGYELKGPSHKQMTGVAAGTVSNVLVKNGKITNASAGVIVGDKSTVKGMIITNIANQGVLASGEDILIQENVITNIYAGYDAAVTGVLVGTCTQGSKRVNVLRNVISGFRRYGNKTAIGIEAGACESVIEGNYLSGDSTGHYGIYVPSAGSGSNLIVGNKFSGGVEKEVFCDLATARYKDNVSTSVYGGTYDCGAAGDLGGNF